MNEEEKEFLKRKNEEARIAGEEVIKKIRELPTFDLTQIDAWNKIERNKETEGLFKFLYPKLKYNYFTPWYKRPFVSIGNFFKGRFSGKQK